MDNPSTTPATCTALHRIGWMVLIWLCSVAALGGVALVIRTLMTLAGMAR